MESDNYHAKEVSPDLDCDVVDMLYLHIEEQYAADSTKEGGTSGCHRSQS